MIIKFKHIRKRTGVLESILVDSTNPYVVIHKDSSGNAILNLDVYDNNLFFRDTIQYVIELFGLSCLKDLNHLAKLLNSMWYIIGGVSLEHGNFPKGNIHPHFVGSYDKLTQAFSIYYGAVEVLTAQTRGNQYTTYNGDMYTHWELSDYVQSHMRPVKGLGKDLITLAEIIDKLNTNLNHTKSLLNRDDLLDEDEVMPYIINDLSNRSFTVDSLDDQEGVVYVAGEEVPLYITEDTIVLGSVRHPMFRGTTDKASVDAFLRVCRYYLENLRKSAAYNPCADIEEV